MSTLKHIPTDALLNEIRDREVREDEVVITSFDEQEVMSHSFNNSLEEK